MAKFDVWYMRPDFVREGMMGLAWLTDHNMVPVPGQLDKTHIFLKTVEAPDLEALFVQMQGEVWSPKGEARSLIASRGLTHTSMSVGDVAVNTSTEPTYHICDNFGWQELPFSAR